MNTKNINFKKIYIFYLIILLIPIFAFYNFPLIKIELSDSSQKLQIFYIFFLILLIFSYNNKIYFYQKINYLLKSLLIFILYILSIEIYSTFFLDLYYQRNLFMIVKIFQIILFFYIYHFYFSKINYNINLELLFLILALTMLLYWLFRISDTYIYRLGMPFEGLSPNLLGSICSFSILGLLLNKFVLNNNKSHLFLFLSSLLVFLLILIMSTSKTNVLCLLISIFLLIIFIFLKKDFKEIIKILLFLSISIIFIIFLYYLNTKLSFFNTNIKYLEKIISLNTIINSGSLNNRFDHWFTSLYLFLSDPNYIYKIIFGLENKYMMDNNFLLIIFNYGFIGFILFIILIYNLLKLNSVIINFSLFYFILICFFSDYLFLAYKSWQIVLFFTLLLYHKEIKYKLSK